MKTYVLKSPEVTRNWWVIDAKGKPLGRIAAKTAQLLQGKHKAAYAPNIDNGDFVIILNAGKFILTGRKASRKKYYHHSGYPGGMRITLFKDMLERKPFFPIEKAVKGMLPKNRISKVMMKKMFLFAGDDHNFKNVPLKEAILLGGK